MNCQSCMFWETHKDEDNFGYCKRYAPGPTVLARIDGMNFQIIWPSTGKDDWCGEHSKRNYS
jgi:hypothetical protein